MKLAFLAEAINKKGQKFLSDTDKAEMASKAADLGSLASAVRDAKDLEGKKAAARKMAVAFRVGGKDKFLASVNNCKTPAEVDKLAYNAMLKGEGKGVK